MRKFWSLAAALVVFAPAVRADEAAEKVIKKAVEAHGGEKALMASKAGEMKIAVGMSVMGLELELTGEVVYSFPDKFKMTMNGDVMGQKLEIAQVVNGDKIKMTMNGMALPIEDKQKEELKQLVINQEMSLIAPLLDKKKFTIKAEKDAKAVEEECSVVLVTAKGLKDTKLYFSKKSGLLVRTESKGLDPMGQNEVDVISDLSDYKKVNGIQTAMTTKVQHDGKQFMTMKASDVKYLEKIDDKKFAVDD